MVVGSSSSLMNRIRRCLHHGSKRRRKNTRYLPWVAVPCLDVANVWDLNILLFQWIIVVGEEGLEPSRPCDRQILSLLCLPFHHSPKLTSLRKTASPFCVSGREA